MSDLTPRTRKGQRNRAKALRTHHLPPQLLTLDAQLIGTDPVVSRTLDVTSSLTLSDLHNVLQAAFDWEHAHLHDFQAGARRWQPAEEIQGNRLFGPPTQPVERTYLLEALGTTGDAVTYTYDFGDPWTHAVTTTSVAPLPEGAPPARLIAASNAAPFEDCGGTPGWHHIIAASTLRPRSRRAARLGRGDVWRPLRLRSPVRRHRPSHPPGCGSARR